MFRILSRITRFTVIAILTCSASLSAQNLKTIQLPEPRKTGGMPLLEALANRKSTREFSEQKIVPDVLSTLLWAANGINRPDGRRTAPSSVNWQTLDVYVALPEGLYLYDAKTNTLQPKLDGDIRALTGTQPYVGAAALNLIYVVELSRITRDIDNERKVSIATADVGFIGQNVYLFCASEGLGCVVRGLVDKDALGKKMGLKPDQRIILAQSVGYPKK